MTQDPFAGLDGGPPPAARPRTWRPALTWLVAGVAIAVALLAVITGLQIRQTRHGEQARQEDRDREQIRRLIEVGDQLFALKARLEQSGRDPDELRRVNAAYQRNREEIAALVAYSPAAKQILREDNRQKAIRLGIVLPPDGP